LEAWKYVEEDSSSGTPV